MVDKERINYTVDNGVYVGWSVNLPLVVQGESFEDMKFKMHEIGRVYLGELVKQFMQEEPFDFVKDNSFPFPTTS